MFVAGQLTFQNAAGLEYLLESDAVLNRVSDQSNLSVNSSL